MKITLVLYGQYALRHGSRKEVEVDEGKTIGKLLRELGISANEHHILVNEGKVDEDYVLKDGDVVKLLPVVYGG
ncbi:MoaD/ThiS family protein [Thermococcus sp. GR6]|uniref:MoaD/ThiS family protein n=1 Tax=Thermococcus sp. GR6 TaxID=1638256 RepID=UPI001430A5EE|nr:MoaD/ThiS family protein [Thermococcus sp. GR6]NJE42935.1 MoaD/ThiS family protein [Thermococcus sp. GR6]